MPLSTGARLGSYEVQSPLGAGGMGEVYRAKDTKLGRSVAVKVLPDLFELDPERVSRFEREAKALAALNHPRIASLHGMEEAEGRHFLIMELVEGETIADRLKRGAIPLQEALAIAIQIAEGLEAAHEKGIIHRDLKPANVKITPDGKVKVLDFGLAKAMDAAPADGTLSNSPTLSLMATQHGVILGTAAYMSPEQAKGLQTDPRSDIFSFGVLLCEMLTGRKVFQGDTAADILASVIVRDADVSTLPPNVNPRLPEIIRRCLEKNPKKRWQAIGDLRVELESVAAAPFAVPATQTVAPRYRLWKLALAIVASAVAASAITGFAVWSLTRPAPPIVTRFSILLGEGQQFSNPGRHVVAISPDGARIVYVANRQLYLRVLPEVEARPLLGTEAPRGVVDPAFSPDGQSIAFYSPGEETVKRIPVGGGPQTTICTAGMSFGLNWSRDGILVGQGPAGIIRVSPDGGRPETVITVKPGEDAHGPQLLPDGRTVMFTLASVRQGGDRWDKGHIVLQSIGSSERKTLIEGGTDARYLPTGHIVYGSGNVLYGVRFDARRQQIVGGPVPLIEGIRGSTGSVAGAVQYGISANGSLVYIASPLSGSTHLAISDRKGGVEVLNIPAGRYETPRVSPDGKRIAFTADAGKEGMIAIYELAGTTSMRRLTFGGNNRFPLWSADGQRVAFQSDREGDLGIFWQRADGTGTAERLTRPEPGAAHFPESWSRDGTRLLYRVAGKTAGISLWTLSFPDRKSEPFGGVASPNATAAFSPDGRWVAYTGLEGGMTSVNVQPFPATGAKYQIVTTAIHPVWAPSGKELFFQRPGETGAVTVSTDSGFTFGPPFDVPRAGRIEVGPGGARNHDIFPDGQRFIGVHDATTSRAGTVSIPRIQVVLNWFEELKQRVPR
jgi:Tol biopolymer transport system component